MSNASGDSRMNVTFLLENRSLAETAQTAQTAAQTGATDNPATIPSTNSGTDTAAVGLEQRGLQYSRAAVQANAADASTHGYLIPFTVSSHAPDSVPDSVPEVEWVFGLNSLVVKVDKCMGISSFVSRVMLESALRAKGDSRIYDCPRDEDKGKWIQVRRWGFLECLDDIFAVQGEAGAEALTRLWNR